MATERKRTKKYSTKGYSSYGNVAYRPEYEPVRREADSPGVQTEERKARRYKVKVRQQSPVALSAVVGFVAVIASVFLLLSSAIQLAVVADETYDLQDQLEELQEEGKKLQAQYELSYDLSAIKQEMTTVGSMQNASSADTVYLNVEKTDSVVYYDEAAKGIRGLVDKAEALIHDLLS